MRTPLDAFHQALVNLVEERRRTEQPVRRRRRMGLTESTASPGVRVQLRMPTNLLLERAWADLALFDRSHGTIENIRYYGGSSLPTVDVLLDGDSTPGSWSIPITFLDLADPPPSGNNIEEIEAWLAS